MLFKSFFILKFYLIFINAVIGSPLKLKARQLGGCSPVQLIHAAGTTEMGLGTVGTPLASALASVIPGTTRYAVPYSTSAEYFATVQAGANMAAQHIASQAARCPNQRFILSGYSKGAMVVHNIRLNPSVKSRVIAILVFGDPLRSMGTATWPINSPRVNLHPRTGGSGQNVASFCNPGDMFCAPPGMLPPHIAYPMDGSIGIAARFAARARGQSGKIGGDYNVNPPYQGTKYPLGAARLPLGGARPLSEGAREGGSPSGGEGTIGGESTGGGEGTGGGGEGAGEIEGTGGSDVSTGGGEGTAGGSEGVGGVEGSTGGGEGATGGLGNLFGGGGGSPFGGLGKFFGGAGGSPFGGLGGGGGGPFGGFPWRRRSATVLDWMKRTLL